MLLVYVFPLLNARPALTRSPGHYRLWVNGIHHGDISLNNLMYDLSATGKPEGVLNDYDLATWDKIPTTNNDRTGTMPFLALNMLRAMLSNRPEERIPRLYRHDAESFTWVLVYITVVSVEYNNLTVKISRPRLLNPWFKEDVDGHLTSKRSFPSSYGRFVNVTGPHERYVAAVRNLVDHWVQLEVKLYDLGPKGPENDDPEGTLENLVEDMGEDVQFMKVKTLLFEAIRTPKVL